MKRIRVTVVLLILLAFVAASIGAGHAATTRASMDMSKVKTDLKSISNKLQVKKPDSPVKYDYAQYGKDMASGIINRTYSDMATATGNTGGTNTTLNNTTKYNATNANMTGNNTAINNKTANNTTDKDMQGVNTTKGNETAYGWKDMGMPALNNTGMNNSIQKPKQDVTSGMPTLSNKKAKLSDVKAPGSDLVILFDGS